MTTLDLVDLSTSLPSPISEDATLHTPHPSAAAAHHILGQEQTSPVGNRTSALEDSTTALGDDTTALGDGTRMERTVPLVLPPVEVPQRERRGMSCSLQRTTQSKNQPRAAKEDSFRKRVRGRSAIPQRASTREALPNMQQLASECSEGDAYTGNSWMFQLVAVGSDPPSLSCVQPHKPDGAHGLPLLRQYATKNNL